MKLFYHLIFILVVFAIYTIPSFVHAQDNKNTCIISDRLCVMTLLQSTIPTIEKQSWKDQTSRELAKIMAQDGYFDQAIAIIDSIENPDTKALTIRGIGFAAANLNLSDTDLTTLFTTLRAEAQNIDHPPSYAIALTYIAMAQAFAEQDSAAMETAATMENDALRNKAYGETAEIQAEMGKFDLAMESISKIDSLSFRNKATRIVSRILAEQGYFQESLEAALMIENPYQKTSALQFLLETHADDLDLDLDSDSEFENGLEDDEAENTP